MTELQLAKSQKVERLACQGSVAELGLSRCLSSGTLGLSRERNCATLQLPTGDLWRSASTKDFTSIDQSLALFEPLSARGRGHSPGSRDLGCVCVAQHPVPGIPPPLDQIGGKLPQATPDIACLMRGPSSSCTNHAAKAM